MSLFIKHFRKIYVEDEYLHRKVTSRFLSYLIERSILTFDILDEKDKINDELLSEKIKRLNELENDSKEEPNERGEVYLLILEKNELRHDLYCNTKKINYLLDWINEELFIYNKGYPQNNEKSSYLYYDKISFFNSTASIIFAYTHFLTAIVINHTNCKCKSTFPFPYNQCFDDCNGYFKKDIEDDEKSYDYFLRKALYFIIEKINIILLEDEEISQITDSYFIQKLQLCYLQLHLCYLHIGYLIREYDIQYELDDEKTVLANQLIDRAKSVENYKYYKMFFLIMEKYEGVDDSVIEKNKIYFKKYNIITMSRNFIELLSIIENISDTDASIHITGESGTGKELLARTIYKKSNRNNNPFIPINCGAISPNLLESELFGSVKGSFTGANKDRNGYFSEADGGTIFLDEIGDMPLDLQIKLLRVLESGEYYRVGDSTHRKTNVRIISATHQSLKNENREIPFRQDLLYRINTFELEIPPLRERPIDIAYLAQYYFELYFEKYVSTNEKLTFKIEPWSFYPLLLRKWKGNVRELSSYIEKVVIMIKNSISEMTPEILNEVVINNDSDLDELIENIDTTELNIFRHQMYRKAVLAYINSNYKIDGENGAIVVLGVSWKTAKRHIYSGFLQLGHYTDFKIDSFKDVLIEIGNTTNQETLTKHVIKVFTRIIEFKLKNHNELKHLKADEKAGYIDELIKAFPDIVKSVQSQLK
jgi:DNA-binding NtrC family response regulator